MQFVCVDPGYISKKKLDEISLIKGITKYQYYEHSPVNKIEYIDRIKEAELITSRVYFKLNAEIISHAPKLKAIFTQSVGFDYVDIDFAKQKNIRVYNCPGYNSNAVAEFIFSLIISLLRKIPAAQEHVKSGGIEYRIFEGSELKGKKIGVIGAGNIGQRILEIARGYQMIPLVHTHNPSQERAKSLGIERFFNLVELLKSADIVVIAVPLTKNTKGLIGEKELSLMKKTAILINTARQTIVDEYALAEHLIKGRISGAALDMVINDPFQIDDYPIIIQEMVNLPNVIVTPHIAAETIEANYRLGDYFLSNIRNFLRGSNQNCVNF